MAYGNDFSSVAGDERGRMALNLQAQQAAQDAYFRQMANRQAYDQMAQQADLANVANQTAGYFNDQNLNLQRQQMARQGEQVDFARSRVPIEDAFRERDFEARTSHNKALENYWPLELQSRMDVAKLGMANKTADASAREQDVIMGRAAKAKGMEEELRHLKDSGSLYESKKMGEYKDWALGDFQKNRGAFSTLVDKLVNREPIVDATTLPQYSPKTAEPAAAGKLRGLDEKYSKDISNYKGEFEKWLAKIRSEGFGYDESTGRVVDIAYPQTNVQTGPPMDASSILGAQPQSPAAVTVGPDGRFIFNNDFMRAK